MSARRVADKPISIPENAKFLTFTRSDGDPRNWPSNTTETIDNEGHVNFMQVVDVDSPPAIRWRIAMGQGAAVALKHPGPDYVLADWPDGYRLYDHHKGPADNPRHDLYLFGPTGRRFRSINEFLPHAIWLLKEPTGGSPCLCKYCSKKTQREVTASLPGILRSTSGTQSPTPSRPKPKGKSIRETALRNQAQVREPKVYAAVQRAPRPVGVTKSANVSAKQVMLVERNADLRAVYSSTGMKLKRWFRVGELLWCALDPPIKRDNVAIRFWPGLVDEVRLKSRPVSHGTASTNPRTHMELPHEGRNGEDVVVENSKGSASWTVEQSTVYKIQLLAVTHSYIVNDNQVLPYQAHVPPNELIKELQAVPPQDLNFNREALSNFNPCSGAASPKFADAVAPYAMAVQIGSVLSGYWCLTDEWTFGYTTPLPKTDASRAGPSSGPTSLQDALEAASLDNSQSFPPASSGPISYQHHSDVTGPRANISTPELQELSGRLMGKTLPGASFSQMRFQGLWWGAERIWTDDFIRLKIPRRCLAPGGAENILPPSGPGESARKLWEESGRDPSEIGAGARGVFMRLDGLYVVDAVQPDGFTKKECRASGMLYELADLDWDEPELSENRKTTSSSASRPPSTNKQLNPFPLPPPNPHLKKIPTESPSTQTTNPISPSNQLSHPSPPYYLPPTAPEGYRFRPILPDGHESVISLSLISGRYYPRLLCHPLLEISMREALTNPLENGGLLQSNHLWALEGLAAGFYNSVDPRQYKTSRSKMVEEADKNAAAELAMHKERRIKEEEDIGLEQDGDALMGELVYPQPMDIDGS